MASSLALIVCGGPSPRPLPGEAPPPHLGTPGVVQFAAVGDTGKGNAGQRAVGQAMAQVCETRGCDFVLLLGDNLYDRGFESPMDPRMKARFDDVYGPIHRPVYGVLGNHDYGHGRDTQAARWQLAWAAGHDQMQMPAPYYSFEAGPAAFFALDTTSVFWEGAATQSAWLEQALPASDAAWKIAFGHHPYRSNGRHGNAGAYEGLSHVPLVAGGALRELFDARLCGGVDLYLAGHDHNLQSLQWCGVNLVVSGAGATQKEIVDRGNETAFETASLGFAWIRLDANLTVAFFDSEGALLFERVLSR